MKGGPEWTENGLPKMAAKSPDEDRDDRKPFSHCREPTGQNWERRVEPEDRRL